MVKVETCLMMACLLAPLGRAASAAAFDRFSRGKRHLLVGDFKSAVAAFEVCLLLRRQQSPWWSCVGSRRPSVVTRTRRCGRALLELARKEAGVLGPDLDGASSQEGSTGEEEDEEEES
ncbi:uncharacterized protein LOC135090366 isoform X1 [Scylla paramamosain]|uniref:uncharacterized protein LOC135090366 isoform X1 n=1 Tax=Scylla paramamosain TaxID=85552 RepID=UPI00308393AC